VALFTVSLHGSLKSSHTFLFHVCPRDVVHKRSAKERARGTLGEDRDYSLKFAN
jgi:hypothetical protein